MPAPAPCPSPHHPFDEDARRGRSPHRRLGDLDATGRAARLHARGRVDRLAPQVEEDALAPDHAAHHRTAGQADAQDRLPWIWRRRKRHRERHDRAKREGDARGRRSRLPAARWVPRRGRGRGVLPACETGDASDVQRHFRASSTHWPGQKRVVVLEQHRVYAHALEAAPPHLHPGTRAACSTHSRIWGRCASSSVVTLT